MEPVNSPKGIAKELAKDFARQVRQIDHPIGHYVAGVVLAVGRPPRDQAELREIMAAQSKDVPAAEIVEKLRRHDARVDELTRAHNARVRELLAASSKPPTPKPAPKPVGAALRLVGEAAAAAERAAAMAAAPSNALVLQPGIFDDAPTQQRRQR
jgi:hypothetical protein